MAIMIWIRAGVIVSDASQIEGAIASDENAEDAGRPAFQIMAEGPPPIMLVLTNGLVKFQE